MNTRLDQKKQELKELKEKIRELQKARKSLYDYIYTTEMRQKEKIM